MPNYFVVFIFICTLLNVWISNGTVTTDEDDLQHQPKPRSSVNQVMASDHNKKRASEQIVKRTIKAAQSDFCDWRTNPLANIRGHVCGSHYKVLGLNRKKDIVDKNSVRKAYRQMSLAVHPDKNPASDADAAFQLIQEAYECLSDDGCRENFDSVIEIKEQKLKLRRLEIKHTIVENARKVAISTYQNAWNIAHQVHHGINTLWDWAGDITIRIADSEVPVGRGALVLSIFSRIGRAFFVLHLLSAIFMKFDDKGNRFLDVWN
jgi:hypothetical protein